MNVADPLLEIAENGWREIALAALVGNGVGNLRKIQPQRMLKNQITTGLANLKSEIFLVRVFSSEHGRSP